MTNFTVYQLKGNSFEEAPSTAEAIQAAKDQYEGTKFLTDISIDDRTEWEIGYSIQCITVEGLAHR